MFYKKDDKIRLLRVSNMQALNRFDKLKGAITKIILDSGFKPDNIKPLYKSKSFDT
ncbi:hypothetical protein ACSM59_000038 [Campylobacter jejuni]